MRPFEWANEESMTFMRRGYLAEGQTIEEHQKAIAKYAQDLLNNIKVNGKPNKGRKDIAEKYYDYMSKGYYSQSSPVLSNFRPDTSATAVSCFGTMIEDNIPSILRAHAEIGMMSKLGGGASAYFGKLRPRGAKISTGGATHGVVHFIQMFESLVDVISQGNVRRGFMSPYLDMEHPDAEDFIRIRSEGHPIQQLTHGVVYSDNFMRRLEEGDKKARALHLQVIKNRREKGVPYIIFGDTMNRNTVDVYKDKGMKIYASNMCSEIALPSSPEESFVCVLSSMNVLKYDEWKDTDAVEVLVYFLDAVVEDFLTKMERLRDSEKAEDRQGFMYMERAYRFAKRHRALGIGQLGWWDYLQSKMIPFESDEAKRLNIEIAETIQTRAWEASEQMAKEYGEPELLEGYGRRHTTLTAIAPTKSSSFILGQVSQGIEPRKSNIYPEDLAKTKSLYKNKYLMQVLENRGKNERDIWDSVVNNGGSVQHLDFLSEHEKMVFKTFAEVSQDAIIEQAADRQKWIDQSQSLNLMNSKEVTPKEMHRIIKKAWELGIKSLYYQDTENAAQKHASCLSCQA